jgi:catechol 2,3-dioxygenase-like lactoylglutathione lyase family enzyme
MTDEPKKPTAAVRYVFNVCNDIPAMRRFYVELLGLEEAAFMDTPEFAWLSVNCGGFQMMWFRADEEQPVPEEFACQPGWEGGVLEVTSWAVSIPEGDFAAVFEKLADAGAKLFQPVPDWRQDSYWGLSVLDPMGVTVEVFSAPAEKPAETDWPGQGRPEQA